MWSKRFLVVKPILVFSFGFDQVEQMFLMFSIIIRMTNFEIFKTFEISNISSFASPLAVCGQLCAFVTTWDINHSISFHVILGDIVLVFIFRLKKNNSLSGFRIQSLSICVNIYNKYCDMLPCRPTYSIK